MAAERPVSAVPPLSGTGLGPLVDGWLVHLGARELSPNTLRAYRYYIRVYDEFLLARGVRYDRVDFGTVDLYLVHLRQTLGMAPHSVSSMFSAVKSLYSWLKRGGYVWENIPREVRGPKLPKLLPKPISEEEVGRITETARADPLMYAIVQTLYASGCRNAELCGMRLQDLQLDRAEVLVMGKGARERLLLLGAPAVEAIRAWIDYRRGRGETLRPESPLWIGPSGRPLKGRRLRQLIGALAKKAGIESNVWPHRFRHAVGTHLHDHGADLRDIQEILGHELIESTQIYTHVSRARLRKVYDQAHPRA